jgi:hypothetical protein
MGRMPLGRRLCVIKLSLTLPCRAIAFCRRRIQKVVTNATFRGIRRRMEIHRRIVGLPLQLGACKVLEGSHAVRFCSQQRGPQCAVDRPGNGEPNVFHVTLWLAHGAHALDALGPGFRNRLGKEGTRLGFESLWADNARYLSRAAGSSPSPMYQAGQVHQWIHRRRDAAGGSRT